MYRRLNQTELRTRNLADFAGSVLGELRKLYAFGLAHIEHVRGAETDKNGCADCCRVFALVSLGVLLLAVAVNVALIETYWSKVSSCRAKYLRLAGERA